jgi:hypothetical protein
VDPKSEAMIEHLLIQGAIEISGLDVDGEMTYSITDKLQSVNPMLYNELKDQFESHMFRLIEQGPKTMNWRINVR